VQQYPIQLGSMLFTVVEPHPGHELAYNRWYERDHFYAGVMIGKYSFAGRRFVATRAEKALRYPADSPLLPDPMRGSYVAVYWVLKGHHDAWSDWSVGQVNWLHANGRMFPHRDHDYTIVAEHDWVAYRDDDGVPAELALDHPFAGLVAVVGAPAEGVERGRIDAWYRAEHLPRALADSPIAMCLSFTPKPLQADAPGDVPRSDGERFVHLYFLETDPKDAWADHFARHGELLEASGLGRVEWATPFIPTLPGTDTYTDALR